MTSPSSPESVIGPAAVRALTEAGYTLVPPKEPARIVRMEESNERFRLAVGVAHVGSLPECYYAADDWLVKAVNRRLIEALRPLRSDDQRVIVGEDRCAVYSVNRNHLLSLFCGEAP